MAPLADKMHRIETERLLLREFQFQDWKQVHAYASDPKVVQYLEWGPNSKEETIKFVEGTMACARETPRRIWEFAVLLKGTQDLIGATGIRISDTDPEQAELGYCYNRDFWGAGLGTEAARALVQFGFKELNLHRIWASCDALNLGSAGVLRKTGMRQEAHLLQDRKARGHWRDSFQFAILREEWQHRLENGDE